MKYLILGLGLTGKSIKSFFDKNNIDYDYYDDNYINTYNEKIDYDCLIKSSGINNEHFLVKNFREKGKKIYTDLELLSLYKPKKSICVTGTNGKSTTVKLIKCILSDYDLVGNIGKPIFYDLHNDIKDKKLIIECSSYMCEYVYDYFPDISILLNIYPNHLDHHKTISKYIESKLNLIKNTKDFIIFNNDDVICKDVINNINANRYSFSLCNKESTLYVKNNNIYYKNKYIGKLRLNNYYLENYKEDVLAVILLCLLLNISLDVIIDKINSFKGLEHRLELLYKNNTLEIYNDSKSTNIYALNKALKAFEGKNISLICGGYKNKIEGNIDFENNVNRIIIYGENKYDLKLKFIESGYDKNIITLCDKLEDAILSINLNNVILFSPASQSYDEFENFEERGNKFKELINKRIT